MGFLDVVKDVVTKPVEAVADAGKAVVDTVTDAGEAVVDTAKDAAGVVAEGAKDIANSDGWAGLAWRLNPVTGPVLAGVDTVRAGVDLATGKPGASVWDIPVLGFAKGAGEGAVDLVKGVGYLAETSIKSNPLRAIWDREGYEQQWKDNYETAKFVVTHPLDVAKAVVEPIVSDVEGGRPYEAQGRGAFEVLNVIFGAKGANKLSTLIKGGDAAADAGRAGQVVDDAGRAADDAGRAADDAGRAADDAGRAADDAADAGGSATRRASDADLDEFVPGLTAEERAAAADIDVRHLFEFDPVDGGFHHAPNGPGTYGDVTVTATKPPKPGRTWKADVSTPEGSKPSTMFPNEWSREDVVRAVLDARKNAVEVPGGRDGARVLIGESRGIQIRMIEAPDGSITTAFPKSADKAFTS